MGLTIELEGLELWGHHGVEEDERRDGQRFLFDVWLDVSDAALSDRIEEHVDYPQVATGGRRRDPKPPRARGRRGRAGSRRL